ncbi:MAG: hypothetical protein JO002_02835, partial [Burkholderiaceae bacterium]|nr:hypothetical protein [Burkholderiaceae bacterium]
DFDIDWLRVAPYIGGLTLIAKSLFTALEGFSARFEGVEEYEFLLRAYEHSGASCFRHVPRMLMHRHEESGHSLCEPSELQALMREAVSAHLARQGLSAKVGIGSQPATLDVEYVAAREPSVAVIIPVDGVAFEIKPLIQWLEHVQYGRLSCHFIGSDKAQIDVLTTELSQCAPAGEWQVRHFIGPWASQVNQAIASIDAELVLLAHGGLSSAGSDWLRRLIGQCLRPGVGVVGCRLVHPDGRLVHAGLTGGVDHQPVFPVEAGLAKGKPGYLQRAYLPHRVLAVDERCMMFSKALFTTLGGFDHVAFPDRYAHVDFCLRSAEHGDTTISDNAVELVLRGVGEVVRFKPSDKVMAEHPEREQMFARWLPTLVRDPSYNVNLRLDDVNASIEPARIYTLGDDWRPAPRIIAFPFDHWGRGLYRIKAPATSMANAGLIQGGWCERIYGPTEIARVRPDAIVVQQQLEGGGYEAIERYKRFGNAFAVFDMDDLINFAPNKELAWSERVSGHIEKKLRRAIGACDRLVVSTPFLAEAYGDFCVEVRVQPNCVELAQWGNFQPRRRQGDKPRIGWAGGNTHIEDLELLDGVIAATWQEVDWIFFGMCPDRLRPYAAEVHSGVAIDAYPTKLASLDLDLAVAPLVDNIFSHAKSALKLLEYGILGYPTICTDITPYQGEFPAWRVQNTTDEWIDAIRAAIADRDALARAGDALRDYVRQHCTLEGNLEAWRASWLPD